MCFLVSVCMYLDACFLVSVCMYLDACLYLGIVCVSCSQCGPLVLFMYSVSLLSRFFSLSRFFCFAYSILDCSYVASALTLSWSVHFSKLSSRAVLGLILFCVSCFDLGWYSLWWMITVDLLSFSDNHSVIASRRVAQHLCKRRPLSLPSRGHRLMVRSG